jgi:hypothetical protein
MGLKKLGKWVKKNIKPIATVAAIVYPPLIPMIGSALVPAGASAVVTAAAGAAALSGAASAVSGDKPSDILKNAALGGIVGGTVATVSPTAFDSGLFSGGGAAPAAAPTSTGVTNGLMGSTLPVGAGAGGTQAVAASSLGATAAQYLTSPAGVSAATQVASDVASKGLIGDVLTKASQLTGLSEGTLGQLGSAGVQALLSGYAASKTADTQRQAAQTAADAQIEAARIAAEAAKFRPVGVTTRFGSSNFGYDAQGNLVTAGYTPSAEITGYQDRLRTLAGQGMTDIEGARAAYQPLTGAAQSLFSLGQGYLAKSPEQAAADYISKQQALITPSRQTQLAEVQNRLFQQGRTGAATAQGGNLMNTNPELAAYYNALAQQDLVLAAQADEEARRRIEFGSGLFDTGANLQGKYYAGQTAAYQPFATAMDTSAGLENLAQAPLTLGTQIGAKTTASSAEAGRLLSSGITGAAATMLPSNAYSLTGDVLGGIAQSPLVTSAIDKAFGVQPQQRTYTVEELKTIFGT